METIRKGLFTDIQLSRDELQEILVKKLVRLKKNECTTLHGVHPNIAVTIRIHHVGKQTQKQISSREKSLMNAKLIKLSDFLLSCDSVISKESKPTLSRARNALSNVMEGETLFDFISLPRKDIEKYRNVGTKAMDIIEKVLKKNGHRFAVWNGKAYV